MLHPHLTSPWKLIFTHKSRGVKGAEVGLRILHNVMSESMKDKSGKSVQMRRCLREEFRVQTTGLVHGHEELKILPTSPQGDRKSTR